MKITKTERGFGRLEFTDLYGSQCSLQESSLATQAAIWLGVNNPNPQIMATDARRLGLLTRETNGWVPYPLPDGVIISTRMHLTQEQVRELLPLLQHFAETGNLPEPEEA